jgi:hypothetical protein
VRQRDHGLRRAQLDGVRRGVAVAIAQPLQLVEDPAYCERVINSWDDANGRFVPENPRCIKARWSGEDPKQ